MAELRFLLSSRFASFAFLASLAAWSRGREVKCPKFVVWGTASIVFSDVVFEAEGFTCRIWGARRF